MRSVLYTTQHALAIARIADTSIFHAFTKLLIKSFTRLLINGYAYDCYFRQFYSLTLLLHLASIDSTVSRVFVLRFPNSCSKPWSTIEVPELKWNSWKFRTLWRFGPSTGGEWAAWPGSALLWFSIHWLALGPVFPNPVSTWLAQHIGCQGVRVAMHSFAWITRYHKHTAKNCKHTFKVFQHVIQVWVG